jgi:putative transcriptional regulator
MTDATRKPQYLTGQLLIAMPAMPDQRFQRSVIYICAHNPDGAMGLVINKLFGSITFPDLLEQLGIDTPGHAANMRVHFGGPVESGRGFVLHSTDFVREGTMTVDDDVALTATVDILRAIARGDGPANAVLALGYAGWGAGQLELEMQANGWLNCPADSELIFNTSIDARYDLALRSLGIEPAMLSMQAGHA